MLWIAAVALLLAFANGANDNFKGVATLFGSRTTGYRGALAWATATTALGSLTAILLAGELLARFRGKGLVPDELVLDPRFTAAVALGAGATVLLATRLGMPTSTTHALIGGLLGAGLAAGGPVHLGPLATKLALPLLSSPLLALSATALLYPVLRVARRRSGVQEDTCFCVGERTLEAVPALSPRMTAVRRRELSVAVGAEVACVTRYRGRVMGIQAGAVLDALHYLSAGAVSFARGLNDTPKIAALLFVLPALEPVLALVLVGAAIAVGGITAAQRVAYTMSERITPMNAGQGFTANLVSALLILGASRIGVPVSTTHVSCGSLFGLGLVTGQADRRSMARIVLAWVVTLPLAALIAAAGRGVLA